MLRKISHSVPEKNPQPEVCNLTPGTILYSDEQHQQGLEDGTI